MNVAVGSMFCNSTAYLERYFAQVTALRDALHPQGHALRLILAEGDSTDNTWDALHAATTGPEAIPAEIVKRAHGGPMFGSVNIDRRWRQISYVCDGILERVTPADDALLYVESDLIWQAETMVTLLGHLEHVDAVAPMAMRGETFYDIWGYVADQRHFQPDAPYHPMLESPESRRVLHELLSAGSCIAVRGAIARKTRFRPPELAIMGWCHQMLQMGHRLWLDPTVQTQHP